MAVTTSNPIPTPSIINLLDSGSGTINGSGAAVDIASFSTAGDLGNKTLVVEWTNEKILGASTCRFGIQSTSATNPVLCTNATILNTVSYGKLQLRKGTNTQSLTHLSISENCGGPIIHNDRSWCVNTAGINFDLSTAETLYITFNAAVGENIKYNYVAYIIG